MRIAFLLVSLIGMTVNAQNNYNLLVGTYTNECKSEGIYVYDFNVATLEFKAKGNTHGIVNPSYLCVSKDNSVVYSVNEDGNKSGVSAFKYTPANGKLNLLNAKDSQGADPCYIINDDKNVIVANYTGGSVAVFGKKQDGSLTDVKQVVQHSGNSINKERQEKAHVHMVHFSPDKKYLFVNDLGTDKISIYNYNPDGGNNTLTLKESITVKAGSGPRHLVFHPNGIFFYVLHELDASLSVYSYIKEKVELIQETTIVSEGFVGAVGAADIHFSNDGKFIYATNRGDANSISVFRVHANGRMNLVQRISTQGSSPRNFTIDPTDNYVLVANQKTNNISI
ncbi:MAG TPA: lactonase family protein, partial [Flavobacterium sp.]|nr:lactonase family protein [Flavobacterium sp.]